MGLAKKQRKKYVSHKQRWHKATILEEDSLVKDYALKNKKEIRKVEKLIKKFKKIAKNFNRDAETTSSTEAKQFMDSLKAKGFLSQDAESMDEVLDIKPRDILERRLTTIVYKHKMAKSASQARQFIVHRHVKVAGRLVDSPSYLVPLAEEQEVVFLEKSALANEAHPERALESHGVAEELEEIEETPLKEQEEQTFDEKEAELDDEEVDEVKE